MGSNSGSVRRVEDGARETEQAIQVGAAAALSEAMGHSCMDKACKCDGGLTCDYCLPRIMRAGLNAALPIAVAGQAARHREAERELDHAAKEIDSLTTRLHRAEIRSEQAEAEVARLRARLAEAKRWLVMCQASMMSPRHFEFVANALTEIRKGATA